MKDFGECDFESCPYWRPDEIRNGFCTYDPMKCFIDEQRETILNPNCSESVLALDVTKLSKADQEKVRTEIENIHPSKFTDKDGEQTVDDNIPETWEIFIEQLFSLTIVRVDNAYYDGEKIDEIARKYNVKVEELQSE